MTRGQQLVGISTGPVGFPMEWEWISRLRWNGNRKGNDISGKGSNKNVTVPPKILDFAVDV